MSAATWRSWAQLVRLPNTLTAVADILAGASLATASLGAVSHGNGIMQPWPALLLLALASIGLYWSGMVLNDVNDVEEDRQQRRSRPLTRGEISLARARALGWGLIGFSLAAALATAWLGSPSSDRWFVWLPVIVAGLLSVAIVVYDSGWKSLPIAPGIMGLCRGLNIALGASLGSLQASSSTELWLTMPHFWLTAVGHGLYVTGFTIAARREALTSSRRQLAGGWTLCGLGCTTLAFAPNWVPSGQFLHIAPDRWYPILIALLVLPLVKRAYYTVRDPSGPVVQMAIKQSIMTIILLDAAATLQYAGPVWGTACCLMILPSLWLGRFLRST